jgi:hypothetical protein
MLPASIEPSALPAPTMVCSSSMNRMTWPFLLGQVVEHRLQALLELAAELGAGDQRAHVQRQQTLVLQAFRHLAVDDALGEALDDGGLADAGLADQHRVVLGAPLQHLDGAADLVVAADHRIELALLGALGQVDGVFLQRLALLLGVGVFTIARWRRSRAPVRAARTLVLALRGSGPPRWTLAVFLPWCLGPYQDARPSWRCLLAELQPPATATTRIKAIKGKTRTRE